MSEIAVQKPLRRVGMISLGCPKNLVDSEIMLGQLREDSAVEITNDLDQADVVIVNTCGFIDAAKQESIDTILEVAGRKGKGLERLIVTGCMVQKYRADLQQSIPEIDAFVGLDAREAEDVGPPLRGSAASPGAGKRARVSEGLRGLLESVHLLCDPADAREVPQPDHRVARSRSEGAGGPGRQGTLPRGAGHHALRTGPRPRPWPHRADEHSSRRDRI